MSGSAYYSDRENSIMILLQLQNHPTTNPQQINYVIMHRCGSNIFLLAGNIISKEHLIMKRTGIFMAMPVLDLMFGHVH